MSFTLFDCKYSITVFFNSKPAWSAQMAIDNAEKESFDLIHTFYDMLKRPYDEQPENEKWFAKRPDWAREKVGCSMLSCSS